MDQRHHVRHPHFYLIASTIYIISFDVIIWFYHIWRQIWNRISFPWLGYLSPQCAHCCSTQPGCPLHPLILNDSTDCGPWPPGVLEVDGMGGFKVHLYWLWLSPKSRFCWTFHRDSVLHCLLDSCPRIESSTTSDVIDGVELMDTKKTDWCGKAWYKVCELKKTIILKQTSSQDRQDIVQTSMGNTVPKGLKYLYVLTSLP